MGKPRKLPEDYHALASERGFSWLGPNVLNNAAGTYWRCEYGHTWRASYGNIRAGKACPDCARSVRANKHRIPAVAYAQLAQQRGFDWLGPSVRRTDEHTRWRCSHGHIWSATLDKIRAGRNCPYCSRRARITHDDYTSIAFARGFYWLGPQVPRSLDNTRWKCAEGHTWEASYNAVKNCGSGCPHCAGLLPKSPFDYQALAHIRGFEWLGPMVERVIYKTGWRCSLGHDWQARYNDLQQGRGCPQCRDMENGARVSKPQRTLNHMLNGTLNYSVARYKIDVAIIRDGVHVAVEYDSWYWHRHKQAHDNKRDRDLIALGWHILRIKSDELLPTRHQLDQAIEALVAGSHYEEIVLADWSP